MNEFDILKSRLKEDVEVLEHAILNGNLKTLEEYRFLTGQLHGLTVAIEHVKALESQIEKWDE